jgi:hypothetical protein
MTVRIHYDGATYTEVNHDLDDVLGRLTAILKSNVGYGTFRVETATGIVELFISHATPVAVELEEPPLSAYERDDLGLL